VVRALFATALVAVATALPAAANAPSSAFVPRLYATVSTSAISLKDRTGARVRVIPSNTYKIIVRDMTKAQNFRITGPGLSRRTGVAAKTSAVWVVQLLPGQYVYRSDKSTKLRGTFAVSEVPPA
jgi:hypothetical protein